MFERLLALIALFFLSPLLVLCLLFIFIEDGCPIFFKQKRVGVNESLFWIFKFRSMKNNTPNVATDKLENPEYYILKVGKIIRKLSLDELPNLINVLKGEMVFVGPRPALYNQVDLLKLRKNTGVHELRPGITGWAQINGRDDISDLKKVELEKYYLDNKSIKLDLLIIYRTFFSVMSKNGVNH